MTDTQTYLAIAGVVAVVAIVLYVWDCRNKAESVDWMNATKLGIGAGGIAGGVAFAVGGDAIAEASSSVVDAAQEMFVGKPGF
jgi:hypothetical protein